MREYVVNSNIFTVDALYHQAQLASIHLIRSKDRIAVVDTGTTNSIPQIQQALSELQLDFSHIDYVILTHIHLDHAGGASALMKLCVNASLVVHPKGARHMVNPQKLIDGTIAVYGEEAFKSLYGEILPIEADRIIQPSEGEVIDFAERPLKFIDTPGHASHHHSVIDAQTNSVFTGDTLGVGYRALRDGDKAFVAVTTTPVQFNPEALHASIDKVMDYEPEWLYLTHYSALKPSAQNIAGLHEQIDDFVSLTQQCSESFSENEDFEQQLSAQLLEYLVRRCLNELPSIEEELVRHWLKLDAQLNAQGLVFWWQYRRVK
jgi:glyoxylase-like metal-dependent hydrolase (beta-lactamase superfamily II)